MAMVESPNSIDDYIRISEKTSREFFYKLARGFVEIFGGVYLWKPLLSNMQSLYATHKERHGFWGIFRSIDYTH